MSQIRPQVRHNPEDPALSLMNATAMIEVARRTDTPEAKRFLALYHDHEARIAGESPDLSETALRAKAVIEALKSMGKRVTVGGVPI